jgi:catechol 2,3-dioxygenase-like lactoylglutathione lyase family enzyme
MRIRLTSVLVGDQEAAHRFYTGVLGFATKHDVPMGDGNRWLTVVSPEEPEGPELLLEPVSFAPARTYQRALLEAGIPAASFTVDDIEGEHARLVAAGVTFRSGPTNLGPVTIATFEDGCGNLIQLAAR